MTRDGSKRIVVEHDFGVSPWTIRFIALTLAVIAVCMAALVLYIPEVVDTADAGVRAVESLETTLRNRP